MGIVKKYARATISSNLRDDAYHHDHEKLAAVAAAGLIDGVWPHSNMLLRVKYAGDASSYPRLAEEWRALVKIKAALRGWPVEVSASKVARLALNHWLTDVCPACGGRGGLPHNEITSVISDDPCPVCAGAGTRPLELRPVAVRDYGSATICIWFPHIRPARLIPYVQAMVELLEGLTIRAGSEAIRQLAGDMPNLR